MLSILIPTYNETCVPLVHQLRTMANRAKGLRYEIIVADDGSVDGDSLESNRKIREWEHCRFIECGVNRGRPAIRNFLASQAKYDWLLFLDCDVRPLLDSFLTTYLEAGDVADVVCGGVNSVDYLPSPEYSLRFRYDATAEKRQTVEFRQKHPFMQFTTQNFLIRRKLFLAIRFDEENIKHYGYEDALFGIELEEKGVRLRHIYNPIIHLGLDKNNVYLEKSETALRTLHSLSNKMRRRASVSSMANRMERLHLKPLVLLWHKWFAGLERKNLLGKHPFIWVLQLYKLGYYCNLE